MSEVFEGLYYDLGIGLWSKVIDSVTDKSIVFLSINLFNYTLCFD